MNNDKFKKRIMRSVYTVFIMKKLFSTFSLKIYSFVGSVWIGASLVSLRNVFQNMLNMADFSGFYSFFTYAFLHTTAIVQVLFVIITFLTVSILSDLVKKSLSQDFLRVSGV